MEETSENEGFLPKGQKLAAVGGRECGVKTWSRQFGVTLSGRFVTRQVEKLAENWRGCGFEGGIVGDCRARFVPTGVTQ